MKNILSTILILFQFLGLFSQTYLPESKGEIISHSYYTLSYIEDHEQAEWVYYKLTHDMFETSVERTDNFRNDPLVSTGSSSPNDYYKSGYDRGHLAPAGDMKKNRQIMSESFYMSNISPQNPSFNRGGWKKIESLVRDWAHNGEIHVVTGGVLRNGLNKIGNNRVSVPLYFYKIIFDSNKNKMIGFLTPNQKLASSVESYVYSVDYIESFTGIDFFPGLDDELEDRLESQKQLNQWSFNITRSSSSSPVSFTLSSQCLGIAKSTGNRCKNLTKNENGYCYAHQSQSPDYKPPAKSDYVGRCNATTKAGTRCKRNASSGSRYCWQHG